MDNLQRARTEQLNKESAARLAKQKADKAVVDAQSSQNAAVAALTDAHRKFGEQQQEVNRLADERNAAQARLDAARNWSAPAGGPGAGPRAASSPGDRWDPAAPGSPSRPTGNNGQWDGAGIRRCRRCPAPTFPATRSRSEQGPRDDVDVIGSHVQHGPQLPAADSDWLPRRPASPTARSRGCTAGRPPST